MARGAKGGWRPLAVFVHRWAGLLTLLPLLLAAISGSLLAFHAELERWINPQRYATPAALPRLDMAQLVRQAAAQLPGVEITAIHAEGTQGATYVMVRPRGPAAIDQVFLDPWTGRVLDVTRAADLSAGSASIMAFLYKFHHTLVLGHTGLLIMGIAALIWTLDCFVGLALTLPRRRHRHTVDSEGYLRRWGRSWRVKTGGSTFRLLFDIHRAGSLWLWAVLLVLAWSSVYMNLWDTVYTPVTRAVMEYHAPWTDLQPRPHPVERPGLDWIEAHAQAKAHMASQAAHHGFSVTSEVQMKLDRERGVYTYRVRSSRDLQDRRGRTDVLIDADTGALRMLILPTAQYTGNTVTYWLYALHMGNVFGLPYRVFLCALGLMIAVIAVTGGYVWFRKWQVRAAERAVA